jgi:hypothetical protein
MFFDKINPNQIQKIDIDFDICKSEKWPKHSMRRNFKPQHGVDPVAEMAEKKDYENRLPKTQRRQFNDVDETSITSKRPSNVPASPAERQKIAIERAKSLSKSLDSVIGKLEKEYKLDPNWKPLPGGAKTEAEQRNHYLGKFKSLAEDVGYPEQHEIDRMFPGKNYKRIEDMSTSDLDRMYLHHYRSHSPIK